MKHYRLLLSVLAVILSSTGAARCAEPDPKALEFFEKKIRPVFVEHCYSCHSQQAKKDKKLKGKLYLDSAGGILAGGESGAIIVSGKPRESLLMKALRQDTELKMPPSDKLAQSALADVETWIKMGAAMPADRQAGNQQASFDWDKARQFWAFQPPKKYSAPKVKDEHWSKREIDNFVLAELEKRGLKPNKPASKREWIRRATFDLIGLPPTPEEIDAFLKDESPQAFAKVVDRLLASPHYGERWGRYWLDVVRYADDKALAIAKASPFAFRYRDWVIAAFNQDMPYDRFLKLQIAGDLLNEPNIDPFTKVAGLGFQGLGAEYHKGNFAAQVMADELDDRVDTLSRGLLGLTVACARCHDHKYDPIPTRDYYSLAAAYQGASMSELPVSPPEVVTKYAEWERDTKKQEAEMTQWFADRGNALADSAMQKLDQYLLATYRIRVLRDRKFAHDADAIARDEKLSPYFLNRLLKAMQSGGNSRLPALLTPFHEAAEKTIRTATLSGTTVNIPDDLRKLASSVQAAVRDIPPEPKEKAGPKKASANLTRKALSASGQMPFFVDPKELPNLLDKAERAQYDDKKAKLEQLKKSPPPAPLKIHGVSGGGQPMRVHIRGRVENLGEDAPPGFLRILQQTSTGKPGARGSFTRLELASAIATSQNPLTARVYVNRIWQHHFGRGIVGTPSNFGKLGELPTHPELLDSLAVRFIEAGWSTKWLHRELMLSATYLLNSENSPEYAAKDPENQFLWRMPPGRLDIEAWRDSLLAVSGRLDRTLGGPTIELGSPKNVRRTIYATVSRSVPDGTLTAFDFPDANVSSDRRSVTTVPQQQLFVLNSGFMIECARAFAARLESAAKEDGERINLAFQLAYGRLPTEAENKLGLDFLRSAGEFQKQDKLTPWQQYAQALLGTNEFTWVD